MGSIVAEGAWVTPTMKSIFIFSVALYSFALAILEATSFIDVNDVSGTILALGHHTFCDKDPLRCRRRPCSVSALAGTAVLYVGQLRP